MGHNPYVAVLRRPGLGGRLVAVFLSALPLAMVPLGVVLCVRQWTGTFGLAGIATGAFGLGNACGLAVQGRAIERVGPRAVIGLAGTCCACAIAVFLIGGSSGGPPSLIVAALLVAGFCIPAITAAVRAWLPVVLGEHTERVASYALLAVSFQAAIAIGPILVGLLVAWGEPVLAVAAAAVSVLVATGVFLVVAGRTPVLPTRPREEALPSVWTPGLVVVLVVAALTGAASGTALVTLPAIAIAAGSAAVSGAMFAALAVGELGGALLFGRLSRRGSLPDQLAIALALLAALWGTAAVVARATVPLVLALACVGLAMSPVTILISTLIDEVTLAGVVARAYSMTVSVGLVSAAAGSAAAGLVGEPLGPRLMLICPATLAFASALVVLRRRRRLESPA